MVRYPFLVALSVVLVFTICTLALSNKASSAWYFSAESVEEYNDCDCGGPDLNYTNNITTWFVNKMNSYSNWTKRFHYMDSNAWITDFMEDEIYVVWGGRNIWGEDYPYIDTINSLAWFSGHGWGAADDGYWKGQSCPNTSYPGTPLCYFISTAMVLGEKSGTYYYPHAGSLKWLVLDSCMSIDEDGADDVWDNVFDSACDMHLIMGFNSAVFWDSGDIYKGWYFALYSEGYNWTLADAWIICNEGHSHEPALITFESSSAEALARVNNEKYWVSPYYYYHDPESNEYYAMIWED